MIKLAKSVIGQEECEAVQRVLELEYLGMGKEVQLFEEDLTSFIGVPAVCVSNGTSALQLSLQACDIGFGDEVLVQSLTYVASFQAISATGAIPIACDISPRTLTIDLSDAEKRITTKTKAIMPVHYSGNPGDLNAIYKFAQKHKLRVIEDAAHAFGSKYNNKYIGSQGDIVCFSFDGIKNITSGEGGAVMSKDKNILARIRDLRMLGVLNDSQNRYKNERTWDFDVVEQGWRYHMSNIMAAIGRAQLSKFDHFKNRRQEICKQYVSCFKRYQGIQLVTINYDDIVPFNFVIQIHPNVRKKVFEAFRNQDIQSGVHYKPNHLLSYYRTEYNLPHTENIYNRMITLPLHIDLTKEEVGRICSTVLSSGNMV